LGKSEATWPSGPRPSRMTSNTGRPARAMHTASGDDAASPNQP
jgi:hypothetical protein